MRRPYYIIGVVLLVTLFASCGQRHKAQQRVKAFVEAYAADPDRLLGSATFGQLDSTRVISDSVLQAMRRQAEHDTLFGPGIRYEAERLAATLYFIRMKYREGEGGEESSRTFYLNPDLAAVVAFK